MKHLSLGPVAFYWRMTLAPNVPPNLVPDFVEFDFTFLPELQLIIQTRRAKTLEYLATIYRKHYNVGYLQEGHALAEGYGGDFIAWVERALTTYHPHAKRISEVGAGGGYVLKKLKEKGYEVAAIDPSPVAIEKAKEFGIQLVPEFYPSAGAIPKSDLLLHYDVLEHVSDPVDFIRHHAGDLNPGGLVVCAVPDCSPYIALGDVSMILHEHLNYFDAESLRNVMEAGGLEVLEVRKGSYGGVLFCIGRVPADPREWKPSESTQKFADFVSRVSHLRQQVDRFITEGLTAGNTLGCYVPLRAVPYLSMLGLTQGFRFFDDDDGIYGRYFDGFPVPVESMDDLKSKPVSHLLVLSFAFGDTIRSRIDSQLPAHAINIFCLSDVQHAA